MGNPVIPLTLESRETARSIGQIKVDRGETSGKIPGAIVIIAKVERRGNLGKQRKNAFCC